MWEGFGAKISHQFGVVDSSQQETTHRTVLSAEPDTMVLPTRLMATLSTLAVCPRNVLLHSPDARSHTLCRVGRFRRQISLNSRFSQLGSDSPDCFVSRTGHDNFAIGASSHAEHFSSVTLQRVLALTRLHVPNPAHKTQ